MKVLHYTLGLPPARGGGLTKYATDLMTAQSAEDEVALLYPGRSSWLSKHRSLRERSAFGRVRVFELCNPVMIPLLHGIRRPADVLDDPRAFLPQALQAFYERLQPDIFHVHTWMGMPPELVQFLKHRGVRVLYTSHDYFGFCAKVNFVNASGTPCPRPTEGACTQCNANAPSRALLQLRNSPLGLKLKNLAALKPLLKP